MQVVFIIVVAVCLTQISHSSIPQKIDGAEVVEKIYPIVEETLNGEIIHIAVGLAIDKHCVLALTKSLNDKSEKLRSWALSHRKQFVDIEGHKPIGTYLIVNVLNQPNASLAVICYSAIRLKSTFALAKTIDEPRLYRLNRTNDKFEDPKSPLEPNGESLTLSQDAALDTNILLKRNETTQNILEIDSGSPILNRNGELAGILLQNKNENMLDVINLSSSDIQHTIALCIHKAESNTQIERYGNMVWITNTTTNALHNGVHIGAQYVLTVLLGTKISESKIEMEYKGETYAPQAREIVQPFSGSILAVLYFPNVPFKTEFHIISNEISVSPISIFELQPLGAFPVDVNSTTNNPVATTTVQFSSSRTLKSGDKILGAAVLSGDLLFGLVLQHHDQIFNVVNLNSPVIIQLLTNCIKKIHSDIFGDGNNAALPSIVQRTSTISEKIKENEITAEGGAPKDGKKEEMKIYDTKKDRKAIKEKQQIRSRETHSTSEVVVLPSVYPIVRELSEGGTLGMSTGIAYNNHCILTTHTQGNTGMEGYKIQIDVESNAYPITHFDTIKFDNTGYDDLAIICFPAPIFKTRCSLAKTISDHDQLRMYRLAKSAETFASPNSMITPTGEALELCEHTKILVKANIPKDYKPSDAGCPIVNQKNEVVGLVICKRDRRLVSINLTNASVQFNINEQAEKLQARIEDETHKKIIKIKCTGLKTKLLGVVIGPNYLLTVLTNEFIINAEQISEKCFIRRSLKRMRPTFAAHDKLDHIDPTKSVIVLFYFQKVAFKYSFQIYKGQLPNEFYLQRKKKQQTALVLEAQTANIEKTEFKAIAGLNSNEVTTGTPVLSNWYLFGLVVNQLGQKNSNLNVININVLHVAELVERGTAASIEKNLAHNIERVMHTKYSDKGGVLVEGLAVVVSTSCVLSVSLVKLDKLDVVYQSKTYTFTAGTRLSLNGAFLGAYYFEQELFQDTFQLPTKGKMRPPECEWCLQRCRNSLYAENIFNKKLELPFVFEPKCKSRNALKELDKLNISQFDFGAPIYAGQKLFGFVIKQEDKLTYIVNLWDPDQDITAIIDFIKQPPTKVATEHETEQENLEVNATPNTEDKPKKKVKGKGKYSELEKFGGSQKVEECVAESSKKTKARNGILLGTDHDAEHDEETNLQLVLDNEELLPGKKTTYSASRKG